MISSFEREKRERKEYGKENIVSSCDALWLRF